MDWTSYYRPETLAEALALLRKSEGKGAVIAGGTDLILQLMESSEVSPENLRQARRIASEEANPRASSPGSASYAGHLAVREGSS